MVLTKGFALNHDKSLPIFFFCVKRQAKNGFLKDVESTVGKALIISTHKVCFRGEIKTNSFLDMPVV